jgi:hypothetical protein
MLHIFAFKLRITNGSFLDPKTIHVAQKSLADIPKRHPPPCECCGVPFLASLPPFRQFYDEIQAPATFVRLVEYREMCSITLILYMSTFSVPYQLMHLSKNRHSIALLIQ